jgi:hypothetical protein
MVPSFPDVGADLDGWQLADESVETLFEVTGARVRGATRRFEDAATRDAVREATGGELDREWRFVAVTALDFEPALPPGTTAVILPVVRREARAAFDRRLSERGLTDVTRRGHQRLRVAAGTRARLTRFRAVDRVDGRHRIPVAGWVCVWNDRGDLFVVTGGHPDGRIADLLSLDSGSPRLELSSRACREEFVDIVRSVGRSSSAES